MDPIVDIFERRHFTLHEVAVGSCCNFSGHFGAIVVAGEPYAQSGMYHFMRQSHFYLPIRHGVTGLVVYPIGRIQIIEHLLKAYQIASWRRLSHVIKVRAIKLANY